MAFNMATPVRYRRKPIPKGKISPRVDKRCGEDVLNEQC